MALREPRTHRGGKKMGAWLGQKRGVGTGRGTDQNPMRKEGAGKLIRTIS